MINENPVAPVKRKPLRYQRDGFLFLITCIRTYVLIIIRTKRTYVLITEAGKMYEKYVGRIVTIIYEDKKGNITQRRIRIVDVSDGQIKAHDLDRKAPRLFDAGHILAMQVSRYAG